MRDRVSLQVFLAENPRPVKQEPVPIREGLRHKAKLCKTCPHRITVSHTAGPKEFAKFRRGLERFIGDGNIPHPCHEDVRNDQPTYCAGHTAEIKVRLARQARKQAKMKAMVRSVLVCLVDWLVIALGWLALAFIGIVCLFVYLFHGGSDNH